MQRFALNNAECGIIGGKAKPCNLKCEAKPRHHSLTANVLTANRLKNYKSF